MTEEQRYATVQDQMKEISDRAAMYNNPALSMLSALLYAEMYTRNERHHNRVIESREGLVRVLQARIGEREVMDAYQQIKQQYDQTFRDLADM